MYGAPDTWLNDRRSQQSAKLHVWNALRRLSYVKQVLWIGMYFEPDGTVKENEGENKTKVTCDGVRGGSTVVPGPQSALRTPADDAYAVVGPRSS